MKIQRVSRWFATGFSIAQKNLPKAKIETVPTTNAWQRSEVVAGYKAFSEEEAHIQFWLVGAGYDHASVEKKLAEEFDNEKKTK